MCLYICCFVPVFMVFIFNSSLIGSGVIFNSKNLLFLYF